MTAAPLRPERRFESAWLASCLALSSLCCLLGPACDGAFRFDGVEAGAASDLGADGLGADGLGADGHVPADASAEAPGDAAGLDGAAMDAASERADGSPCALACAPGGTCVITAGEGCTVTCPGTTCEINLGEGGRAICTGGATCTITCGENCSVACMDTSRCSARCTGSALTMPVATSLVCGGAD